MKVVILAGGYGTRISEESHLKPKPMIEIGERPILWHIMKTYSHYSFNDFVICLGYKGYMIKEYFADYFLHGSDVTFDLAKNSLKIHSSEDVEEWRVTLANTGIDTMTGGRIKRIKKYIGDETFMLTYGDGVADINVHELLAFHKSHGKLATVTAVQPSGRYGVLGLNDDATVLEFVEKPNTLNTWINGGFFILEPEVFDYIDGDDIAFEKEPLAKLAEEGEIVAYHHSGFWKCMDTQRDKVALERLWESGEAPWKVW
ncbi:glucose-1-phosphate cytidylyltransferase [Desulfitobacterium dehalogenans ATCC 51507]|uniref:Glucose-1-phosphate cytidylyltransferase n=1 Tax=Desulfitobacterium dehalogenans (strain ATCC 51507 / DSM 9161 / JW/IU-DC1) TaxID=756499 RepID=I4ACY8_DESDJ|nr:glucose-1-phosphate cytidylyltransferase [Desulfitobacterium dehalogenans]AFM01823.1 glucose-1-phosphate cytidylyltransferase [Desulfitobacterium dehalogenans ATCC 51507]